MNDEIKLVNQLREAEKEVERLKLSLNGFAVRGLQVKQYEDDSFAIALFEPYCHPQLFYTQWKCRRGFCRKDIVEIIKNLQDMIGENNANN